MKLLHINCNYIGTTLHQLMIERLDRTHDNTVYVPTYDKNVAVITPNENVIVSECFNKWDRLVFDYKQRKIFRDIQKQVRVEEFDCIHAYTLFTDGNCARKLSKQYGIPYVVAVRNTDVNDFFRLMVHLRSRGVRILRDAKAIFFLSESYRKQVFDKYVPAKYRDELLQKSHIIPNGIDDFWFDNPPATLPVIDDEVRLIYAGRIDKNKNIATTQQAVRLLRERGVNATLTVVGKPVDRAVYDAVKKDAFTTVLPACGKEELMELYRQHHLFVMPSFTESFGLVYAEAMSQGLPVIYTKGQGFDEQFENGEVGYAVDAASVEQIADAVTKLVARYDEITPTLAEKARRYNWEALVARYCEIYNAI